MSLESFSQDQIDAILEALRPEISRVVEAQFNERLAEIVRKVSEVLDNLNNFCSSLPELVQKSLAAATLSPPFPPSPSTKTADDQSELLTGSQLTQAGPSISTSTSTNIPLTLRLPPEVYQPALAQQAEEANKQILRSADLPHNGQVFKNHYLASVFTLDKATHRYLKKLTWKRLGIFREKKSPRESLKAFMKELKAKFELNKTHTEALNVCIGPNCRGKTVENLIPFARRIFESAIPERIQEVVLWVRLDPDEDPNAFLDDEIDDLLLTIHSFRNLTTFKFYIPSEVAVVSEELLGSIINELPSLQTVVLHGQEGSGQEEEPPYQEYDLGEALASRTQLKSLNLRGLATPNESWLEIDWKGKIEELSIGWADCDLDALPSIAFPRLFTKTLISLFFVDYSEGWGQNEAPATEFKALKFITIGGDEGLNLEETILSKFPSVESLTLYNKNFNLDHLKEFFKDRSPHEACWPSLKTINVPQKHYKPRSKSFQRVKEYLDGYSVDLCFVDVKLNENSLSEVTHRLSSLYPYPNLIL
ncbi:hypothetical protein CROQUDRAFT_654535 [Cronartium quercuum f. sp. fusiforme G11]|uniref:Uncharacterized protein n=1 Tax=Cronartium quercuum f. sp. fusiforme G11 TaxID=708437 RepID=A0A9P6NKI5_9BASI|nr:hypothetical protein CROQUDRAFT_654535 [Cronartium quercuum f. sp. fusiforme G11]